MALAHEILKVSVRQRFSLKKITLHVNLRSCTIQTSRRRRTPTSTKHDVWLRFLHRWICTSTAPIALARRFRQAILPHQPLCMEEHLVSRGALHSNDRRRNNTAFQVSTDAVVRMILIHRLLVARDPCSRLHFYLAT
jgi:hypothetical protein